MIRVGFGVDIHRFAATGQFIILGGVKIPCFAGIEAHSDGDVLAHAVMDALLGAAALGDIGQHFPNTPEFKDANSMELLGRVQHLLRKEKYTIHNIDISILAERPKLAPYYPVIRETLAHALKLELMQVNVKATTPEQMGAFGRLEGIAVQAVALISHEKPTNSV